MEALNWSLTASGFATHLLATGKSPETLRTYVSALRIFYVWAVAHEIAPAHATREHYLLFHAEQLAARLSFNTVRNRLHAARSYYNWLGADPNPTEGITVPRTKALPKKPIPIEDQRRIVYGARSLRDEAMWRTLIDTGVRIGELATIKIENIDWHTNLILIVGKGSKERIVWVSDETLAMIREYLAGRRHGPCWLTQDGNPVTRDRARKNFAKLVKRQRVTAHPHQVRATFANEWLRAGGDLGALRVAMGHSDVSTTLLYAAGTENERALATMRALNLTSRLA